MDVFFSALLQVLAPHTFAVMLVGIVVGLLVGILPGLGGAATLAIVAAFFGLVVGHGWFRERPPAA